MNKKFNDITVAKVLNDECTQIVINRGHKEGIDDDMEFMVYEEAEEIFDPVSKESLGKLENPKGRFKVHHIQETMSVLITTLQKPNPFFNPLPVYPFGREKTDTEFDLLRTIKVGDKVKIINASNDIVY